jgi:DNA polymerase I-like protein with 3'-5' exonuclease and polymerase domains
VAPYAIRNVDQVAAADRRLRAPASTDEELTDVRNLEREIIPVVVEMEKNGTYLDLELLHEWQG